MSFLQQMRSAQLTPQKTGIALGIFVVVGTGIVVGVMKFTSGNSDSGISVSTPQRQATITSKTQITAKPVKPAPSGQDYAVIVSRNLFQPLAASTPTPVSTPPPTVFKPKGLAPFQVTTVPKASAPQVAFTGVVVIAGEKYALLESLDEHLAQYTRLGSSAFGYKLMSITDEAVTLEANGETTELNIGANKVDEQITPPAANDTQQTTGPAGNTDNSSTTSPDGAQPNTNFGGGGPFRQRRMRGQRMGEG